MLRVVLATLVGLFFMAMGVVTILADVHVAFKSDTSAHLINQIIGVALIACGGLLVDPVRAGSVIKSLLGFAGPYIPQRRHDDPGNAGPGGPTGGVT